jgi:hypothetical protein
MNPQNLPEPDGKGPYPAADVDHNQDSTSLRTAAKTLFFDVIEHKMQEHMIEVPAPPHLAVHERKYGGEEDGEGARAKLTVMRDAEADLKTQDSTSTKVPKCAASPSMMALVLILLAASTVSAYSYLFGWPWTVPFITSCQEVNSRWCSLASAGIINSTCNEGHTGTYCQPCAAGTYKGAKGADDCVACPLGTYSTVTGAKSETTCVPMNCAAGSASSKEGSASPRDDCMKCQQGFYGAGGADQCLPMNCARGHYASEIASGANHSSHGCHKCPAGTKSLGGSVTECMTVDSCRPGYAPSIAGAGDDDEACAPVSVGFYALGGAGSTALPMSCPPGSVASKPAATSALDGCVPCEGSCNNVTTLTTAARCPSGYNETGKYYYQEKHCYDENEGGHKCAGGCTVKAHWASERPQTCKYWKTGYTCRGLFERLFGLCFRYADCKGRGYHPTGRTCVPDTITIRECILLESKAVVGHQV